MVAPEKPSYRVIGTRPVRPDGIDKVTGRAEYGADVKRKGMIYGRILRSPIAHGHILSIDTSKAEALPGVYAVATNADFGVTPSDGPLYAMADNLLAAEKVRYDGHAVAAVAAASPHIAEDALDLITVKYEQLPAVTDVREAMLPGAPILDENLRTQIRGEGLDLPTNRPTNVAVAMRQMLGDIDAGWKASDVILEREFETDMFHQGYLEPHNSTAYWAEDGALTIWTSTQNPFGIRQQLSNLLRLPLSKVRLVSMEIGGGFGGKLGSHLDAIAAVLARKSGKTVQVVMTRDATLRASGPTSATYSRIKIGAKRDGTIVAGEAYLAYGAGAYPGSNFVQGIETAFAPYSIPNLKLDGFDVLVNRPKNAAYRAPGAPASEFAVESLIDELAAELDIDPLELRLKNVASEGSLQVNGMPQKSLGMREVLEAMKAHPHYNSELRGEHVGRGVAVGWWANAGMETSSTATINGDGTVNLILGSVDIGGTRASIPMQLAETLGIPFEKVQPRIVDTDSVGFTNMTAGSRTAFAGGWAAYELGIAIRQKLRERAAEIWQVEVDEVTYSDEGVLNGPPDADGNPRSLRFAEIASMLARTGGTITVSATINKSSYGSSVAGNIVDVEVDPETGKVQVLRYTAFQDVGTAIHPSYVEGQIQGGCVQGIGMALSEEYVYSEDGRMLNHSLLDYRMPTALDVPMIDTVLIEVPFPGHPYGVRGVGEVPIVPPQPAIRNAVSHALGRYLYKTPMSPRRILEEVLPADS